MELATSEARLPPVAASLRSGSEASWWQSALLADCIRSGGVLLHACMGKRRLAAAGV